MPPKSPRSKEAGRKRAGGRAQATLRAFERLLADLSAQFIHLPAAEVDDAITGALERIVRLLDVDRCQLVRLGSRVGDVDVTHSWAVDTQWVVRPKSVAANFPWVFACHRAGKPSVIPNVDAMPDEWAIDRESFLRVGVRAHLGVPLAVSGRAEGSLVFGSMRREIEWSGELVERAMVLGTVLGNALAHKRAQESLDVAIAFERTVSQVLASLLTASRADRDTAMVAGLRELARCFDAERATLWQRVGDTSAFENKHRWLAYDVPAAPRIDAASMPWVFARIARGLIVSFATHDDLPPEAAGDLEALRAIGMGAALCVPLSSSGTVVGALAFASRREQHDWPAELVARAQLVGEVFAAVLAKNEAERREREAETHAAHAARVGAMGVFAASLVHELTQPIAASLANTETAADQLADATPDLDEALAAVRDTVADLRRAGDLIQKLRRFLRRGEVERAPIDVGTFMGDAARFVAANASDRGIEVTVVVPADLPKVVGDGVQLQQVLVNLLVNAIDAASAPAVVQRRVARVTLGATVLGPSVRIEVEDNGEGMDATTLARVFEPFFTTKPQGMGLGLSISRTIVASHGGQLTANSVAGDGSVFRVDLPLPMEPAAADLTREADLRRDAGLWPDGTVFVVDDDASMRRAILRQLQAHGWRVEEFASAEAFLARAPAPGPACIVTDVRMPGLTGLDLQASLARAGSDLPLVFISGHGDVATSVQAMRAGAISYLAKPFTRKELLAAVGEALVRSRDRAERQRDLADLRQRHASLTPREREVFALVARGLLNKVIADRIGTVEGTVKLHRGRVMEKMGASSAADLVRMAERLLGPQDAGAV